MLSRPELAFRIVQAIWVLVVSVVMAVWAYYQFKRKDEPLLEERLAAVNDLRWGERHPHGCMAHYLVNLINGGTTAVRVTDASVTVWRLSEPTSDATVVYLDPLKMKAGQPVATINGISTLTGRYAGGTKRSVVFVFRVSRDAGEILLFEAQGKYSADDEVHEWRTHFFGRTCNVAGGSEV